MWSETFDRVADSYDDPSLRFFDLGADALVEEAMPAPGMRVLDLATGTGKVARRVADAVGPSGAVVGIDLAAAMLLLARANAPTVTLARMDAVRLAVRDRSFDAVTCGSGISFFRRPVVAMREAARVVVPGGQITLSTPALGAFQPQLDVWLEVVREAGHGRPTTGSSDALDTPEGLDAVLARAGLVDRRVRTVPIGYELARPDAFWAVVRGTAWQSSLRGLSDEAVSSARASLADRLSSLGVTTLSVPTIVVSASRPASLADRLRSFHDTRRARARPPISRGGRDVGGP